MRSAIFYRIRKTKNNLKEYHSFVAPQDKRGKKLRKRLKAGEYSILANNCVAGIIYHDLGLQFCTPTINLWLEPDDYFRFLAHLEDYLNPQLTSLVQDEEKTKEFSYPVGRLENACGSVRLNFQHYRTFEEASSIWWERAKRVNLSRLYYVMEVYDRDYTEEIAEAFRRLPGKKIMLTHTRHTQEDWEFPLSCYENDLPPACSIAVDKVRRKRFLEEWDFVAFLNGEGVKKSADF